MGGLIAQQLKSMNKCENQSKMLYDTTQKEKGGGSGYFFSKIFSEIVPQEQKMTVFSPV